MYLQDELDKMKISSRQLADELVGEIFKEKNEVNWQEFGRIKEQELRWILSPPKACSKIVQSAGLEVRHITFEEGNRELQRMQKKRDEQTQLLKEMKDKFK